VLHIRRLAGAVLIGLMLSSGAGLAQIVVPDATRFTESDCQWLRTQFLDACIRSETCGTHPDEDHYPMTMQRNMTSLETVITVAVMHEIEAACERSCKSKHQVDHSALHWSVCLPLMKR
jgi:hypothetical protein